jgi:hypothetical protein
MSGPEGKQGKRGKRKQPFTEREARRLLRAAKAEGENRILRKRPDGTLELVPMIGEAAEREQQENPWDEVLESDAKKPPERAS